MAGKFVLTAELRIQAVNIRDVARTIRRELSDITIDVSVEADTRSLETMERSLNRTRRSADEAASGMEAFGRNAGLAAKRFAGFTIATAVIVGLGRAITRSVGEAISFERELVKISQVTGKTTKDLKGLASQVTQTAISLGVASSSLLEVSRTLAQAGLTARQTSEAMKILAKTDLAPTFDNLKDTTEGAIAILRQFGSQGKSTMQDIKNLEKQLGAINAVSKQFAVESADLITAVRRTGGVFKSAGGNLNELLALFTSVRATTRETAETIATGFRTIFTRIQRVETIDQLKQLGIELQNAKGHFVGPMEAIKRLSLALKDLDPRDFRFNQIVEQLGGFRQIGKVIPLIQQNATAWRAYGVAQRGANSLASDAMKAQAALAVQVQKVREQFAGLIRKVADSESFRTMADVALKLASAFIKVADSLLPLMPMLTTLATLRIGMAVPSFMKGLSTPITRGGGGKVRGFAGGGMVPGTGSRDTIPAMLTPGEFVVRKSSVKKHGTGNLERLNRHAGGGRVRSGRRRYGRVSALSARRDRIQPMMGDAPGSVADPGAAPLGEGAIAPFTTGEGVGVGSFERSGQRVDPVSETLASKGVRNQFGAIFLRPGGINENLVGKIPHDRIMGQLAKKKKNQIPSTGLSKGSEFQFNLRAMSLPEPISKKLERNIYKSVVDGVENSAEDLNKFLGAKGQGTKSKPIDATFLKNMNIDNVVGNMFEGILSKVGMPWGDKAIAGANWDFPKGTSGAGGGIQSAFKGIGDSPSDAKSTYSRKNLKSIMKKAQEDVIAQLKRSHQTKQTAGLKTEGVGRREIEDAMGLRTGRGFGEARENILATGLWEMESGTGAGGTQEKWKRRAAGGRVDSVPALLTPGEFVINKSSASKIGSGNLNRLNQVGAFATGGPVGRIQRFQGGGGVGGIANVAVMATMFAPMIASMAQFDGAIGKAIDTMVTFGVTLVATKFALGSVLSGIVANKAKREMEKKAIEITSDARMSEAEKSESLQYAQEKQAKKTRRTTAALGAFSAGIGVAVALIGMMQKVEKERLDTAKAAGDAQAAAAHASKAAMLGMTKGIVLATGGLTVFTLMLLGVSAPMAILIGAVAAVSAGVWAFNNDITGAGEAAATKAKIETEVLKTSKGYEKALSLITSKSLEGAAKAAAHNAAVEKLSQRYDTLKEQADRYSQAQEGVIATLLKMVGIDPGETDMQASVKGLKTALSGSESEIRSGISAIVQAGVEAGDDFGKISSSPEFIRSTKNLEKIFISLGYSGADLQEAMQSVTENAEAEVKQKAAMQAAAKSQNTAFLALRRKTDILRLGLAGMADAARDAKLALSDLSEIAALASGGTAQTKRVDPSAMFKDITNVGDIGRFAQGAQEAGALFGKAGIEIAAEATNVAKGFKVLPSLIQDIGRTGLDKDKGKQAVKDIIGNRLDHLPKEIQDKFIDKLTALAQEGKLKKGMGAEAVDALVQEVSKDFKAITDLLGQAQKRLTVHINSLGKGFKQLTDVTLQRSKAEMELVGTFDKAVRTIAEATGQKLTLADKDAMRTTKRGVGLGQDAGMANDPAAIGGALRNTQKRIIAANKALQKFSATGKASGALAGQYFDQVRALEKLKERSRRLSGALKDLQNQSARLSDIQGELEQAKQERMARQNLLKEWTFATNDGRKEINQSFAALAQAMRAGDIDSISDEMRPAVGKILDQFQDVELFSGMTGKDIAKQFQVRVLDKMMRAQGMGGVSQQQVKQIFEATPKEEKLINELRSTFMMEGAARAQWIATLGQQENQVMSSIFQMHQDFVARLQATLNNMAGAGGGAPGAAAAGGGVNIGGAAHTVTFARGGSVLYRSSGGSTDTVPAMLTPGEFVMNKSAVGKLGVSNLRRMNAKGYQAGGFVGGIGGLKHHSEFEIPEGEKLPLEVFSPEDIDSFILRNAKSLKIKGPLKKLLKKIRREPEGLKTLSKPFTKIFGENILKGGAEYYNIQKEFHEEFQKHNLTMQMSAEGRVDMTVPGNLSGIVGTLSKLGKLAQRAQRGSGAKDLDQLTKGNWSKDYSKMEGLLHFQYQHYRKEAARKKAETRAKKAAHKPIDSKPKVGSGEQKLIDEFGGGGLPIATMPYRGWNRGWSNIEQRQFKGSSPFGNTADPTGLKAFEFVMGKDPAEPGGPQNRSYAKSLTYGKQYWNHSLFHRWKYANVGGGGKSRYGRNIYPQNAPQDIVTRKPVIGVDPRFVIGQKFNPLWTADPVYGWREDPGAIASSTTRAQDLGNNRPGVDVAAATQSGGISATGGAEHNSYWNTSAGRWIMSAADWVGLNRGGPVYKAKGGSIFKSRGTDTVPAMLTPGEFVVRKSAVDKIGVSNLQSLNSGGGAVPKKTGGIISRPSGGGKALYAAKGRYVAPLAAMDYYDPAAFWNEAAFEGTGKRLPQGSRGRTPEGGTQVSARSHGRAGGGEKIGSGVYANYGADWKPMPGQVVQSADWNAAARVESLPHNVLKDVTKGELFAIDPTLANRVEEGQHSVRELIRRVGVDKQQDVMHMLTSKGRQARMLGLPPSSLFHPQHFHAMTQEATVRRTGFRNQQHYKGVRESERVAEDAARQTKAKRVDPFDLVEPNTERTIQHRPLGSGGKGGGNLDIIGSASKDVEMIPLRSLTETTGVEPMVNRLGGSPISPEQALDERWAVHTEAQQKKLHRKFRAKYAGRIAANQKAYNAEVDSLLKKFSGKSGRYKTGRTGTALVGGDAAGGRRVVSAHPKLTTVEKAWFKYEMEQIKSRYGAKHSYIKQAYKTTQGRVPGHVSAQQAAYRQAGQAPGQVEKTARWGAREAQRGAVGTSTTIKPGGIEDLLGEHRPGRRTTRHGRLFGDTTEGLGARGEKPRGWPSERVKITPDAPSVKPKGLSLGQRANRLALRGRRYVANRGEVGANKKFIRHEKGYLKTKGKLSRIERGLGRQKLLGGTAPWVHPIDAMKGRAERASPRNVFGNRAEAEKVKTNLEIKQRGHQQGMIDAQEKVTRTSSKADDITRKIMEFDQIDKDFVRATKAADAGMDAAGAGAKGGGWLSRFASYTGEGIANAWKGKPGALVNRVVNYGEGTLGGSLAQRAGRIKTSALNLGQARTLRGVGWGVTKTLLRTAAEVAGPLSIPLDWYDFSSRVYGSMNEPEMTADERAGRVQAMRQHKQQETLGRGWGTQDETAMMAWSGVRAAIDTATFGLYSLANMGASIPIGIFAALRGKVRNPGNPILADVRGGNTDYGGMMEDLEDNGVTTDVVGDFISYLGMWAAKKQIDEQGETIGEFSYEAFDRTDALQLKRPELGYVVHDRTEGKAVIKKPEIGGSITNASLKKTGYRGGSGGASKRHTLAKLNDMIFEETMRRHKAGELDDKSYRPGVGGDKTAWTVVVPYADQRESVQRGIGKREMVSRAKTWVAYYVNLPKKMEDLKLLREEGLNDTGWLQGRRGGDQRGDFDPGAMLGASWHRDNSYDDLLRYFGDRGTLGDRPQAGVTGGFVTDPNDLTDPFPMSFIQDFSPPGGPVVPKYLHPMHRYRELHDNALPHLRKMQEKQVEINAVGDISRLRVEEESQRGIGSGLSSSAALQSSQQRDQRAIADAKKFNDAHRGRVQETEAKYLNEEEERKRRGDSEQTRVAFEKLMQMKERLTNLSGQGQSDKPIPTDPLFQERWWLEPHKSALFGGEAGPTVGQMLPRVIEDLKFTSAQYNKIRGRSVAVDTAVEGAGSSLFSTVIGQENRFAYWPEKLSTFEEGKSRSGIPADSWVFKTPKEAAGASGRPPFSEDQQPSGAHRIRFNSDPNKPETGFRPTQGFTAFIQALRGEAVQAGRKEEQKRVKGLTPNERFEEMADRQLFLELNASSLENLVVRPGLYAITKKQRAKWNKGEGVNLLNRKGVDLGPRLPDIVDKRSKTMGARIGFGKSFRGKSRWTEPDFAEGGKSPLASWMPDAQRLNKGGGVDTVPAMLTPGEFIMSKGAVGKYGTGFMKTLNRGGVPGYNKGGMVQYFQGPNNDVVKPPTGGGGGMDLTGIAAALTAAAPTIGLLIGTEITNAFKPIVNTFAQATGLDNFVKSVSSSSDKWGNVATKLNDMNMHHTIGFDGTVLQVGGVDQRLTEGMAEGIKTALGNYVKDIVAGEFINERKKKLGR
jgi:hypothetical protein